MGANVACWGRLRYSCGFVAPVKGNVPGDLLLSCVLCVIWHNGENGDVTAAGRRPVAHPGRCLPPRVKETPI